MAMHKTDRSVIVVHPKQPFLDWVNRTVERPSPVTMEELQDDCLVFLARQQDSFEETLAYIRSLKPRIFEMALASWTPDRSIWPRERTEELFDAWFQLQIYSKVCDLGQGPVHREHGMPAVSLTGTWIVLSSPDFDGDYLRMETTPYVELLRERSGIRGDFHIGLISGSLRGVVDGDRIRFSFEGTDEMDPVDGAGTITGEDERMTFVLEFHDGDTFTFECARQHE
jgi:hypothetical protein